ncbi:hypothetical protein NPIL_153541, partial [Nephila pilipes]
PGSNYSFSAGDTASHFPSGLWCVVGPGLGTEGSGGIRKQVFIGICITLVSATELSSPVDSLASIHSSQLALAGFIRTSGFSWLWISPPWSYSGVWLNARKESCSAA